MDADAIADRLSDRAPKEIARSGVNRAAVAVVLRDRAPSDASGPDVLFIERAQKEGDPWSGHMAFPGGRVDATDASLRAAAERETLEEVGLPLSPARLLGRLDDLEGRHAGRPAGLVISAFVYHHPEPGPLRVNHEVATTHWVPLFELGDEARSVDFRHPAVPDQRYPGILVGVPDRHVVWGLTYRFLELFLETLDQPLRARWPSESG
ncbi:MAG: CoA pyrophosphatase [Myxococcota bacterium]|nr:CoA pyrophosphatase [Myxococcota bacterium]